MNPLEKASTRVLAQDRQFSKNFQFLTIYPRVAGDLYQAAQDIKNILNIDESKDLDLIGRILGVRRFFEDKPLKGRSIGNKKCVVGNKYAMCSPAKWSDSPDLSDQIYRAVLKAKVIKNTSRATLADIERGVASFVSSSNVHVIDDQDMSFRIVFIGALTEVEKYVIDNYDIIPRPQGVEFAGFTQTELSPMLGKSFMVCGNRKAQCMKIL
ncbi:DUF2612 domain-containing protein [Vibrio phage vB_VpP_1]|nr:DUF2612 domain-containing protein [Vibrio phage vB_VpP_1]